jgi:nucleotide-binding universal stress UspA family protein
MALKILVGLDHSPRSPSVLRIAVAVAGKLGARLVLFRAVGLPTEVPEEAYHLSPDELSQWVQKQAEKELQEMGEGIDTVESVAVKLGTPWHGICEAAKEVGAGLVIIGSHAYEGMDRVLGTTSAKVVNHAQCSVLVVRGELSV